MCTGGDNQWRGVGSGLREASNCNHLPYTAVTCQLKAYNTHGDSNIATFTTRTSCDSEDNSIMILYEFIPIVLSISLKSVENFQSMQSLCLPISFEFEFSLRGI